MACEQFQSALHGCVSCNLIHSEEALLLCKVDITLYNKPQGQGKKLLTFTFYNESDSADSDSDNKKSSYHVTVLCL